MAAFKLDRAAVLKSAEGLIDFVNKGPSPYHVVEECKRQLMERNFTELKEKESWEIKPNGLYFVVNNFSTIIAFAVGGQYKPGNGFNAVGAHTDSPCLKVKPRSNRSRCGYLQVGVECYGGGIWHTWFDRDLTVAGRVVVRSSEGLEHKLVHIKKPILCVPNVCIHLARDDHLKFAPNKENHILPVLATSTMQELQKPIDVSSCPAGSVARNHTPHLITLLCKDLSCSPGDVLDFDLHLADTQPATVGGALDEFIHAPRLDNLFNCYTALQGLFDSLPSLAEETNVRMVAMFDNEEVGSQSAQGAGSSLLEFIMRRISNGGSAVAFEESIPKSFLVSADQAHAIHPNYSEKHEYNHTPFLHGGPVLKLNANQRYATTAITASILREIAKKASVPLQEVVVRNDSSCGSTIGPILSAKLGLRTVDIGSPQLSMHSIREMACTTGVLQSILLYTSYFNNFTTLDASIKY
ncbi:PREDICTED: aspartyl aminopeptidase-like [Amphimedon queenslandica]|uniref:Aspartyl aminopeptidase n=1 Tax=Amphimedon queenslandica TaxID=400682 RepID=A0A1X7UM67_AMPQE|nr:PREDICTED: aspartyl aminopeptidase-like [Amphimedon queenslandica]|eukprot:XP_019853573.1 PREDICTED: aspartyl aminopeptidase-like [Amphimedon queenslandica]